MKVHDKWRNVIKTEVLYYCMNYSKKHIVSKVLINFAKNVSDDSTNE